MHRLIDAAVTILAAAILLAVILAPAFAKDDAVVVTADPIVFLQIGTVGDCSGFVTTAFGQPAIVTAGHCAVDAIKENASITAKDSVGRTFETAIVYLDIVHDIAVLEYGDATKHISQAPLGCNATPAVGDDVTIVGYPLDFGKATTFGKISSMHSSFHNELWPDAILVDIFAAPGNSGSAVFDKAGNAIGILVGGDPQFPGLSVVVPITELCHPEIA